QAQPPHGGATDRQRVAFPKLLRQVDVVETVIDSRHERHDLFPEVGAEVTPARAAPRTMRQPGHTLRANARLETFELPHRQMQGSGSLGVGIFPANAALTRPARSTSFLLIVKVSIAGGHFHGAVTG